MRRIVFIIILILNVWPCFAYADDQMLSIEQYIALIQKAEANAPPIVIQGFHGQSYLKNEQGEFVAFGRMSEGNIVVDGTLNGRVVADIKSETSPVGSATSKKFARSSQVLSYDGQESRFLRQPNRLNKSGEAEISPGGQLRIIGSLRFVSLCNGTAASLGYFKPFVDVEGKKSGLLGEYFDIMQKNKWGIQVTHDVIDGIPAIKIHDSARNSYWFDPARGMALLRAECDMKVPGSSSYKRLYIDQLEKIDENTWYPVKGRWEQPQDRFPGLAYKVEFKIDSVKPLNDPMFDYKAAIPAGYVVHDMINNTIFTSTGSREELEHKLAHPTTRVSSLPIPRESSTKPTVESIRQQPIANSIDASPGNWRPWIIGMGIVGLGIAVVLTIWLRKNV